MSFEYLCILMFKSGWNDLKGSKNKTINLYSQLHLNDEENRIYLFYQQEKSN